MKVTLNELTDLVEAVKGLYTIPLPFDTTLALRKFIKEADVATEVFKEKYRALFDKYCELDENGQLIPGEDEGSFKLKDDIDSQEMMKEFNELETLEVDLPDFTINEKDLSSQKMSLSTLGILEKYIV